MRTRSQKHAQQEHLKLHQLENGRCCCPDGNSQVQGVERAPFDAVMVGNHELSGDCLTMSICKDYGCRVVDMYMHLLPCHWAHQQPSACKVIRMNLGPGVHPSVVDMESKGSCCRGLCNDDTAMHCSIRTKVRTIPACQNGSTHNLYMHCPSYMCHLRKESMPSNFEAHLMP